MKDFGKKVLLFGLAAMIFVSVFFSLKTNDYLLEESLKELTKPVSDSALTKSVSSQFLDMVLEDSTFARVYKNTKISAKNQSSFLLEAGDLFLTGTTQSEKNIYLNKNTLIAVQDFSVLIESAESYINVFSFNKPIPIFIDNFVFLLPKESSVKISKTENSSIRNMSHQETAKLVSLERDAAISEKTEKALQSYQKLKSDMRKVVFSTPKTWEKHSNSGIASLFRELQSYLAISIPKQTRAQWFFSEKTKLLSYGLNLLESKKNKEAQKLFEFFRKQLKSQEFIQFFALFPKFEKKWINYQTAVAILPNFNNDDDSKSLKILLEKGVHGFSVLENALANKDIASAQETIKNMRHLGSNRAKRIRLFWNIVQNRFIQNKDSIALYQTFNFNDLKENEAEEVSKEIIELLKIEDIPQNEQGKIIKSLIGTLNKIGSDKFLNESEKEFLSFTKQLKQMGLTKEEIIQIKKEQKLKNKFIRQKNEEKQEKERKNSESKRINNTKQLITFIEKIGIDILTDTIKSNRINKSTQLSGIFKEQRIEMLFQYSSQYFSKIILNEDENNIFKNIFRDEINKIVTIIELKEKEKIDSQKRQQNINLYEYYKKLSKISQISTTSILAKNNMKSYLEPLGFYNINISNAIILDEDLNRAQFSNIQFGSINKIQFVFNRNKKEFENIIFTNGDKVEVKKGIHSESEVLEMLKNISKSE